MRIDEGIKTYVEGKRDYGGMLLPCPFCGSAGKIEHKSGLDSWIIEIPHCWNERSEDERE